MIFECCLAEKQQSKSKQAAMQNGGGNVNDASSSSPSSKLEPTWIHQIFQGTFTSETRCLNCETVILDVVCLICYLCVQYLCFVIFLADTPCQVE